MSLRDMANGAPGTTVTYSGPPELRTELPARSEEQARAQAREILSRAASQVAEAESAVSRLSPGYPSSFSSTIAFLRSRNLAALSAASGSDPFKALQEVRRIADDVQSTAWSLLAAVRRIA